ncbi:hypothetical protein [Tepidiforma sp.]|uniref:hypothetical protein n=1 Tax=Tepidiforma sp. TaxID=2682230 RepID=UPI002ADE6774|nr:hypothetical protein [Tepidiforma sp.]
MAFFALLVVGGVSGLLLLFRGDGTPPGSGDQRQSRVEQLGPAPGPGPNGLGQHPPIRLIHPSGARATVPPGEILYTDHLDFQQGPPPPSSPAWRFYGSTYVLVSGTGVVHADPIEVELPRAGAGDGASVVILAPSGAWQPLPTNPAGGFLRAAVGGAPAPWVVAVAEPVAVAMPPGLEPSRLADFERLAFTDPAAWREEARAWLEANPPAR